MNRQARPGLVFGRIASGAFVLLVVLLALGSVRLLGGAVFAAEIGPGTIAGLPAGECRSGSWAGPDLAAGAPNLPATAGNASFMFANSAVLYDGSGELVCDGFAVSEHRMKDVALSFSIATGRRTVQQGRPLPLETPDSGLFVVQDRSDLWPAQDSQPPADIDGLIRVMVSADQGQHWRHLYTLDTTHLSNASESGYVSIALPSEMVRSLANLQVKVEGLHGGDSDWAAYIDSVFVSYRVARGWQLSVQPVGGTGSSSMPFFGQNQPASFRFESHDESVGFFDKISDTFNAGSPDVDVKVSVVNGEGREVRGISPDVRWSKGQFSAKGAWDIAIAQPSAVKSGKHTVVIELTDSEGNVQSITQDFLWGVLAINTHKSFYRPGETVNFDMAVLNETGAMVCDADMVLKISGQYQAVLSTANGAIRVNNEDCGYMGVTEKPDYEASWKIPDVLLDAAGGRYSLTLTATTKNGTYTITDSFVVDVSQPVIIERQTHTRIMPASPYDVDLYITARNNFNGVITEVVPASFEVDGSFGAQWNSLDGPVAIDKEVSITKGGDKQYLSWHVNLEKGKRYWLRYTYDAPDVSPEFYLLGPLKLKSNKLDFVEPRQWQIASDPSPETFNSSTTWTAPTDVCSVTAEVWGGGGNGYGGNAVAGGGGGGGAYTKGTLTVTPGSNYTVTVGTATNFSQMNGDSSTFVKANAGSSTTTATGAAGGTAQTVSGNIIAAYAGGAGGTGKNTGSAGSKYGGGGGGSATASAAGSAGADGSAGGAGGTGEGAGGAGNVGAADGGSGTAPGGGGGGGGTTSLGGGAGATGRIKLTYTAVSGCNDPTVTVAATGSHIAAADAPSGDLYVGGAFSLVADKSTATITAIKIRETGTVDAQNQLSDVKIYYRVQPTCSNTGSIPSGTTLFNSTGGTFDASSDTTVTGSMPVSVFNVCIYVQMDIAYGAANASTLKLQITNPSTDITASATTFTPGTAAAIGSNVTITRVLPAAPTFSDSDGTNQIAFNNSRQNSTTPTFRASTTFFQSFDRFNLELNTASDFSGTSYTQTFSSTYSSATSYNLTANGLSSSLPTTDGVTYYVRIRASGDSGTTWSSWSSGTWSYTYKASGNPDWFQTTDVQFAADTLSSTTTSGSGSVKLSGGGGTPTHVQSTSTYNSGSAKTLSLAFSSNNTAGNTIVISASYASTLGDTVTCTDSQNNTYTAVTYAYDDISAEYLRVCYASNIAAGANTVTVKYFDTFNAAKAVSNRGLTISEYSGLKPSSPIDIYAASGGFSSDGSTDGATSGSASTTVNGDLIYGSGLQSGAAGSIAAGTNFTLRTKAGSDKIAAEDKVQSSSGSVAALFTMSSGVYNAIMVAFKADTMASSGTVMSNPIAYANGPGATGWDSASWTEDETNGTVSMQVYYKVTTSCDTIVPDAALSSNSTGYASGPIDISGLNTTTYSEICLKATLTQGSGNTPYLQDWAISWSTGGGGNTAPDTPASLTQKKTNDITISTGGWTNEGDVKFTATLTDDDSDDVQLCVEVKPVGTAFDDTDGGDGCGTLVTSGSTASVTIDVSAIGGEDDYHWQAQAKDDNGDYSAWVSYGGNAESAQDVGIDTSAPTGGSVYDGSTASVDITFNDGSLSSISANWDGFVFNISGAPGSNIYEYSIGTTQGGTDVQSWTGTNTSTSATATGLTLQTSKLYYFNVRATDVAGNQSIVSSDGQFVLPSLGFSISPSSIAFNNLNPGNSFTDSSKTTTLTTSTNAYGGYVVRALATDLLKTPDTLHNIGWFNGGTYASPAAWGGGTGFGYTSSDTTIQGSNKFSTGTLYAPFTTTAPGDIVADHTANVSGTSVTNEQYTISYRVTTSSSQVGGTYSTTIIYTVTAQY